MLIFLEPKSRKVFVFAILGMTMGIIASQFNAVFLEQMDNDYFNATVNVTPVVEEIAKALPILFYTFVMAKKGENIIPISYAVGFGFAMLENITTFLQTTDSMNILWVLSRCVGAGLMHGICTAAIGFGLSYVKDQKVLFISGTFALLIFAILYHSIFNILVQSEELKVFGILLPIITYIPFVALYVKKIKKRKEPTK